MNILEAFKQVRALVFDVDGVLTDGTVQVYRDGSQIRTFSIKDGWAVNHAVKEDFLVIIISAGQDESVRKRLEYLGVKEINLGVKDKLGLLKDYAARYNLKKEEVLYMGDDMPDYKPMMHVGVPVCPADAADDIKEIAKYVSTKNGGDGAVREVLEKILKIQGKWPKPEAVLSGVFN